jgi:hypothetical protein
MTDAQAKFCWGVFVTAIEGGIGYWSSCFEYSWSGGDGEPDHRGFEAVVSEHDDRRPWVIDIDTIREGLRLIAEGGHVNQTMTNNIAEAYARLDAGQIDAYDADAIVQAGLFGEVVYG